MRFSGVRHVAVATLLVAGLSVPVVADDAPYGAEHFSGVLLLPDGTTPASAGAVDLLVNGVPVARDVTGYDGRFAVGVPETPELLALAAASGGQLAVQWRTSKLIPAILSPASASNIGISGSAPVFTQNVGDTVAWLVNTVTGAVYDVRDAEPRAYLNPADWQFRLPPLDPDTIVGKVAEHAGALAVFNDPDLVMGNEDLSDPDVIPPLGVLLENIELPFDIPAEVTATTLFDGRPTDVNGSGCERVGGYWYPRPGSPEPTDGLYQDTYVGLFDCDPDDNDKDNDYWAIGFAGEVTTHLRDSDDTWSDMKLWRFKHRLELPSNAGYYWIETEPTSDTSSSAGDIEWSLNVGMPSPSFNVNGTFTPKHQSIAKFHQWRDSKENTNGKGTKVLWHGSWLAKNQQTWPGGPRGTGGGVSFRTPQGTAFKTIVTRTRRTIQTWRCWWEIVESEYRCDPR